MSPPSESLTIEDFSRDLSLEVAPVPRAGEILPVLHHDLAAQYRHHWPREDVVALPRRIIGLMQVGCGDLAAPGRIEDRDVGIAADGDRSLPRVKPHDPGGVARYEVDISRQSIAAAHDHLGVHDGQARLHS